MLRHAPSRRRMEGAGAAAGSGVVQRAVRCRQGCPVSAGLPGSRLRRWGPSVSASISSHGSQ